MSHKNHIVTIVQVELHPMYPQTELVEYCKKVRGGDDPKKCF